MSVPRYQFEPKYWRHISQDAKKLIGMLLKFEPELRYPDCETHPLADVSRIVLTKMPRFNMKVHEAY